MVKFFLSETNKVEITSQIDKPKNNRLPQNEIRLAEIDAQSKKDIGDRRVDLYKFKTGRLIIFVCLALLILLYVIDIILAFYNPGVSIDIGINLYQTIAHILMTTLGFMFAEYMRNNK